MPTAQHKGKCRQNLEYLLTFFCKVQNLSPIINASVVDPASGKITFWHDRHAEHILCTIP